jgi:hypothetical protein
LGAHRVQANAVITAGKSMLRLAARSWVQLRPGVCAWHCQVPSSQYQHSAFWF